MTDERRPAPQFHTAFGLGTFQAAGMWTIGGSTAEAGNPRLRIRLETANSGIHPYVYLRNAADGNVGDVRGAPVFHRPAPELHIPSPGTYYIRVWSDHEPASAY